MVTPSGTQWEIQHGAQRAVAVEVGGGLREYTFDGEPVLEGYAVDRMADGGRGQPLLPWPNRLADGQYEFGGQRLQLPIDEIGRNNAMHGLTRSLNWSLVDQADDQVSVGLVLHPRAGYLFTLSLQLTYSLDDEGLTVRTRAHNLGGEPLPFGAGQHPYFTVGTPTVDTALLTIPAGSRLELDDQRRLPTGRVLPTPDTEYDFRTARPIGTRVLDECFTHLARDADGRARASLAAPDGRRSLHVWLDEHYTHLMAFTGDTLPPEKRRHGLALEPMTCPPNAFRSGTDVIVLEPDATIELSWGIGLAFAEQ